MRNMQHATKQEVTAGYLLSVASAHGHYPLSTIHSTGMHAMHLNFHVVCVVWRLAECAWSNPWPLAVRGLQLQRLSFS
jgi:hypothetical protein